RLVDIHPQPVGCPNRVAAGLGTLKEMNRPVALEHALRRKTRALELPIDIAGENKVPIRPRLAPAAQDLETGVWHPGAIQIEPMPEETPRQRRVGAEPMRVGHLRELSPAKRRIGLPESLRPPKVRQPRIDPHPRASADEQRIGTANRLRRGSKL